MPVHRLNDRQLSALRASMFGFVLQEFHLVPDRSALDNVSAALRYSQVVRRKWRQTAEGLLERVGLSDRMHALPTQRSGGEQQRVCIARAMANDAAVILADEPTGNLDTATRDLLVTQLEAFWRLGRTLVIVIHDSDMASRSEQSLYMTDGRLDASCLK